MLPADARALLECWRRLAGERVVAIALDARLPSELQDELLPACRAAELDCPEVAHPGRGPQGRRVASLISGDGDERRAAAEQLRCTLRRAAEVGARRVLLPAGRLSLSISRAVLAHRFAVGAETGVAALAEQRAVLAARAIDQLSLALDAVLPMAAQLSLELVLPAPSAWPDQLPDLDEATRLLALFEGAPLGTCYGSDWAAVAAALSGQKLLVPNDCRRLACVRVADACGLVPRLPPGTALVGFKTVLAETKDLDQVLTVGPGVSAAEVARAIELLEEIQGSL